LLAFALLTVTIQKVLKISKKLLYDINTWDRIPNTSFSS